MSKGNLFLIVSYLQKQYITNELDYIKLTTDVAITNNGFTINTRLTIVTNTNHYSTKHTEMTICYVFYVWFKALKFQRIITKSLVKAFIFFS